MSRNALPPTRRPSEAALDALTDPGTSGTTVTRDDAGNRGTRGTPDASGNGGNPVASETTENLVTSVTLETADVQGTTGTSITTDTARNPGNPGVSGNSGDLGNSSKPGNSSNSGTSRPVDLREHVKIRRALADEMRDAVWFFSEHGRPRVQLGELLDEAVSDWLDQVKRDHNGGEDFPRKGRLR